MLAGRDSETELSRATAPATPALFAADTLDCLHEAASWVPALITLAEARVEIEAEVGAPASERATVAAEEKEGASEAERQRSPRSRKRVSCTVVDAGEMNFDSGEPGGATIPSTAMT